MEFRVFRPTETKFGVMRRRMFIRITSFIVCGYTSFLLDVFSGSFKLLYFSLTDYISKVRILISTGRSPFFHSIGENTINSSVCTRKTGSCPDVVPS